MKLKPGMAVMMAAVLLVAGIGVSQLLGLWSTESTKTPARFEGVEGFSGEYRADDIRGSFTFGEISDLYGVPLGHLAQAFGVDETNAAAFTCKDLDSMYTGTDIEIGTGSVKMFIAFYLGQPYELEDSTYLPVAAGEVLRQYGKPTAEQLAYLQSHLAADTAPPLESAASTTSAGSVQGLQQGNGTGSGSGTGSGALTEIEIKGSDSIADLSKSYGIPLEDFAAAFLLNSVEAQNFQVKDIKNKFAGKEGMIGTSSIKLFIACYNGIEIDSSGLEANLTRQGTDVVSEKGTPTPAQLAYLETHTVDV